MLNIRLTVPKNRVFNLKTRFTELFLCYLELEPLIHGDGN